MEDKCRVFVFVLFQVERTTKTVLGMYYLKQKKKQNKKHRLVNYIVTQKDLLLEIEPRVATITRNEKEASMWYV